MSLFEPTILKICMSNPQVLWYDDLDYYCGFYDIVLVMQLDNFFIPNACNNTSGNPRASPICSRWLMSLLLGLLSYSSSNILFTPFTKASKHSTTVLWLILTYSFTLSAGDPYVNIRIVVVHFYKDERPLLLDALDLIWKYR